MRPTLLRSTCHVYFLPFNPQSSTSQMRHFRNNKEFNHPTFSSWWLSKNVFPSPWNQIAPLESLAWHFIYSFWGPFCCGWLVWYFRIPKNQSNISKKNKKIPKYPRYFMKPSWYHPPGSTRSHRHFARATISATTLRATATCSFKYLGIPQDCLENRDLIWVNHRTIGLVSGSTTRFVVFDENNKTFFYPIFNLHSMHWVLYM